MTKNMDAVLEKIKELILNSDLSSSEQDDLIALFADSENRNLEPMLKLFTEDPLWINKIYENYKAKRAAIIAGDAALWQKIIAEEKSQLEKPE
jgi:hypothetical protein